MACSFLAKMVPWFVGLCAVGFGASGCEREEVPRKESLPIVPAPEKAPIPETKVAAPEAPGERSVRLLVVGAPEPLASEKAQLQALRAALEKAKLAVDAAPATSVEKQAAVDLASQKPVEVSEWSRFETVLILQVVEPEGSETGKRMSHGRGHLFLLHPPQKEPTFSTVYETAAQGASLDGGKLGVWLATHLRLKKGLLGEEPPLPKQDEALVKKGAN